MTPPYLRIADEIRRRIEAGELVPGDPVPSTRRITDEWGVAMATAAKALRALVEQGLVEAIPRVGTVVKGRPPVRRRETELTKDLIVRAATEIADEEGLAALSMRAIADRLGVTTMAPYRHVTNKEDLVLLMIDAAMGEARFPALPPDGWRARLELAARGQWALYRRHPWLAQAISLTRPQVLHNALVHGEFMLSALEELDLDPKICFHMYLTVFNHVRGTAVNLQWEREAERASGLTDEQWMDQQQAEFDAMATSGPFPAFARLAATDFDYELILDALFEFGLNRLLDGIEAFVTR
jgi:DNA-binding transcriptional regulator YhcF (GntR family)